jgi:1-acyl-sn-glycerol-3-phosphate acyltransferase
MWFYLLIFFFVVTLWLWFVHKSKAHAEVDWGHPHANFVDGSVRWFCRSFHRMPDITIPLPETGPAIVVANHVSGLDPFLLITASKRPLRFLVAREQYRRMGQHWLLRAAGCIPVDRERRPEKALRLAFEALARGEVVALFPQGGIQWPVEAEKRIKGGAIKMAIHSTAPIFPVRIDGIGLPGYTLLSFFIPSRVNMEVKPVFSCDQEADYEQSLKLLDQLLKK